MTADQLKRLALGLGALVLIWAALTLVRGRATDRAAGFEPSRLDRAAVTAVVIMRPGDTITLAKEADRWTVNGLVAAPDLVDQLLADLGDTASRGEMIAENPSTHARLGLDSASAKRVTVRAGERDLAAYLVGHRGSGFESVYLRRPGDDRAFLVRSRLGDAADRQVSDWRDKRILTLAADSIGTVEVERGRTGFTAVRADSGWRIGGTPADSGSVARWLQDLANLAASGFPAPAETNSANFERPDRTIRVRGRGGQLLAALAIDSVAAGFLVRREGEPTVFRIDSWTANQITPSDSSLRARAR